MWFGVRMYVVGVVSIDFKAIKEKFKVNFDDKRLLKVRNFYYHSPQLF
jgi:hypothetical protein